MEFFEILSPMRNNGMRATLSERDGKFLVDVDDSDGEGGWINVYAGVFLTSEARDKYWEGFTHAVELFDDNAEIREVESFDEVESDESDD